MRGAAVGTEFAGGRGGGRGSELEAGASGEEGWLNPSIVALVGEQRKVKMKQPAEGGFVAAGDGEEEVAGAGNGEAVVAQEPAVDIHLAFVGGFPGIIECEGAAGAGGFVVDDDQLAGVGLPKIVHGAVNQKAAGFVMESHADKVLAPGRQFGVRKRDGVDAVLGHQRMGLPFLAVEVEFFLEQVVDGAV